MSDEKQEQSAREGEEKSAAKTDTSRIELSDAETESLPEGKEPLSVRRIVDASEPGEAKKSQTSRIDVGDAEPAPEAMSPDAEKESTVRVDLTGVMGRGKAQEDKRAPEADDSGAQDPRDATARISLEGVPAAPSSAEPPRTVRLKRPSAPPRTVVMKKSTDEAPEGKAADADKGATSRIQIPDSVVSESPAAGRKTIRIKRSTGAGGSPAKTLTIARPSKSKGPALSARADAVRSELSTARSEEPGALIGVVSIAAVLVLCVLVYVLLAQTLLPALPVPGRIL